MQAEAPRHWLRSLRRLEASYDLVHVQVLSPTAAVVTMMHHLGWIGSAGMPGDWTQVPV